LRPPFGLTIAPATYWGVVGVMGVLVPRRWCQKEAQHNIYKISQKNAILPGYLKTTDRPHLLF
jgi:hypothetical protein